MLEELEQYKDQAQELAGMAARLAGEYRRAGMSQSAAMKRAWAETKKAALSAADSIGEAVEIHISLPLEQSGEAAKTLGELLRGAGEDGKDSFVQLGERLRDLQVQLREVFDGAGQLAEQFARTEAGDFGLTGMQAREYQQRYLLLGKALGMTEEQAGKVSRTLAGLAGDAAKLYGISPDRAAEALAGILTADSDALEVLGMRFEGLAWQQFQMQQGVGQVYDELSAAHRAAVRYSYVLTQLRDAMGLVERTQESWAGQTQLLGARWSDFCALVSQTLGSVLWPAVQLVNELLAKINSGLAALGEWLGIQFVGIPERMEVLTGVQAEGAQAAKAAASAQNSYASAAKKAGQAASRATVGIDELNILQRESAAASGSASGGTGGAEDIGDIQLIRKPGVAARNAGWLKAWWSDAAGWLKDRIPRAFFDIFGAARDSAQTALESGGNLLEALWQDLQPGFALLGEIGTDMLEGIGAAWDAYGRPVLEHCRTAVEKLGDTAQTVYDRMIGPVLEHLMEQLDWLWTEHLKPLWDQAAQMLGAVGEAALSLWNGALLPLGKAVAEVLGPLVETTLNHITDTFGTLLAAASDLLGGVLRVLEGLCEFVSGVFTGSWQKAWNGVKDIFGGVWDGIVGIVKGAVNTVIDLINWVIAAITGGINAVIGGLNQISVTIPEWVPGFGGSHFGINIPPLSGYQIPRLAAGAVLPANREFLAVLGDQRRGTNVEAPLDTIKQAVAEVLAQTGGAQPISLNVVCTLDGETVYRSQQRIQAGKGYPIGLNPAFV